METFQVILTSATVEEATVEIEANSADEAKEKVLAEFQEGMGAYESDLCVVAGHTDVRMKEGEYNDTVRIKRIESLFALGPYEWWEAGRDDLAVRNLLADLHCYCAIRGVNFEQESSAGKDKFMHEWNHGK